MPPVPYPAPIDYSDEESDEDDEPKKKRGSKKWKVSRNLRWSLTGTHTDPTENHVTYLADLLFSQLFRIPTSRSVP